MGTNTFRQNLMKKTGCNTLDLVMLQRIQVSMWQFFTFKKDFDSKCWLFPVWTSCEIKSWIHTQAGISFGLLKPRWEHFLHKKVREGTRNQRNRWGCREQTPFPQTQSSFGRLTHNRKTNVKENSPYNSALTTKTDLDRRTATFFPRAARYSMTDGLPALE